MLADVGQPVDADDLARALARAAAHARDERVPRGEALELAPRRLGHRGRRPGRRRSAPACRRRRGRARRARGSAASWIRASTAVASRRDSRRPRVVPGRAYCPGCPARVFLALGLVIAAALGVGVGLAGLRRRPAGRDPDDGARGRDPRARSGRRRRRGTLLAAAPPAATPLATGGVRLPGRRLGRDGDLDERLGDRRQSRRRRRAASPASCSSAARSPPTPSSPARTRRRPRRPPTATSTERWPRTSQALGAPVTGEPGGARRLGDADAQRPRTSSARTTKDRAATRAPSPRSTSASTLDHGGLPAGTRDPDRLRRGAAPTRCRRRAEARDAGGDHDHHDDDDDDDDDDDHDRREVTTTPKTTTTPSQAEARDQADDDGGGARSPTDTGRRLRPSAPPGLFPFPPELSPALEGGPYVFPVFGKVGYGNTYGEIRVGRQLPPRRRHLRRARPADRRASPTARSSRSAGTRSAATGSGCATAQGNAFYYAHLSAFSTLVFNGARVKAGQVRRLHGLHRRRRGHADAPPLRGAPRLAALPRLRRRDRPDAVPRRVRGGSSGCRSRSPPGWAPSVTGGNAAPQPGAILLVGLRHLERGRPRPRRRCAARSRRRSRGPSAVALGRG